MALTPISEYVVMYSANVFPPRIWLKHGGRYIGQLIFLEDGATLPGDQLVGDQVYLYYHFRHYANCIDLLRNEQPVFLLFNGNPRENGIKTLAEEVGEGETEPPLPEGTL